MRGTGTKFAADAMLGSLSRKLRAFGLDTAYYKKGADEGILRLARAEDRVILTSDRALFAMASSKAIPALLVEGRTDGSRISSLLRSAGAAGIHVERGSPLCSICNGELEAISRAQAASGVPAAILRRHRLFFRCKKCAKHYWRGGHWKKLSRLQRAFGHSA